MLKKVVDDLFQSSQIYKRTPARAIDFVQPLGYSVIQSLQSKNIKKSKPTSTQRTVFEFPQAIFTKNTLNKKGPQNQEDFCVRDVGRKNVIAGADNFKEFKDREWEIIRNRKLIKYFDTPKEQLLKYIELLQYIPRDHLFTIHDYAISEYFYFCQSTNSALRDYLQAFFNHEIIQYKVTPTHIQSIYSSEDTSFLKVDIENLEEVEDMIQKLHDKNYRCDPFYNGYQLFLGLEDMPVVEDQKFESQEERFLKYLQYYVLMITSVLADGQLAVLKVYSSIHQKTNEYLFLLRWMFNKLTIVKPMLCNHLDHQKFIICEGYRKSAGVKVNKLIKDNYGMLKKSGELMLLVKQEVIDKTEYKNFMVEYNNKVLNNEFKRLNNMLNDNPNTLIRPHEEFLVQKLKNAYSPDDYVSNALQNMFKQKREILENEAKAKQIQQKAMIVEEKQQETTETERPAQRSGFYAVVKRKVN